jgi:aflatoxin B1 aldehyde reductase
MSGLPFVVSFGGAAFMNPERYSKGEDLNPIFDGLDKYGVTHIDTAQLYGDSEKLLGQAKAGQKYVLDTKWLGGFKAGSATKDNVVSSAKESLQKLGVDQVDIFYIHAPDTSIPFAETLEGVNEAHKLGLFKRFGLSVR